MKTKKYIVQFEHAEAGVWEQSNNIGADGQYAKESAERRAKTQERKSAVGLKYRIKEIK